MSASINAFTSKTLQATRKALAHSESPVWKLSKYKYFFPIQARYRDNDNEGRLSDRVYYDLMLSATLRFTNKYVYNENHNLAQTVVGSAFECRKPLGYPQTIIAGLGITVVEKSIVNFCVGFFEANLPEYDGIEDLDLNFSGSLLNDDTIKKLSGCYENNANVVANQMTLFSKKNVAEIPDRMVEGFEMIKIDLQDH